MNSHIKNILWSFVYPPRCALCDEVLAAGESMVCSGCAGKVRPVTDSEQLCAKCGKPIKQGEDYCRDCQTKNTSFDSGRALYIYDDCMKESIAGFKYRGRREYAGYYAAMLWKYFGEWIKNISPDCLVPVPIHRSRMKSRGYNQAYELAKELSKYCGTDVYGNMLVRLKKTLPQKELSDSDRKKNLRDAFDISNEGLELCRKISCVIIIDDIYTTGSTIDACSGVLRNMGIKHIYFLCLCTGDGH